ncbi:MAG: transporter substrate-binding protein [Betaproteobacteria bacterium]|nr:transporter substrate-binding protein [Betaproteobacteria bacterium]
MQRTVTSTVLACAAIAAMAAPVWGQTSYPNRAIRMVAPFAPGGASDFIARMLSPRLSERLGQIVVVDNRSGAGGTIGFEIVVRAAPDGYTLMIASSSYATNAAVTRKLSFDPVKDVTPISLVGVAPLVLVVHPSVTARSIGELVALAKAQPGRLKFGSSGTGGSPHLSGELFKASAGIDLLHVPYKGSGPALIDTLSGQIDMTFISMLVVRAHINAGRLRLLGVGTPQRAKALPEVPAIAETLPGFESTSWYTVMGPARLPATLVARLNREVNALANSPEVADRLANDTVEPKALSPEATAKHVADEITRWKAVAQRAGVRLD